MVIDLTPRSYQQAIFETAKNNNTLVVLPTGVGKTLISLMLTVDRLKKYPGQKILMLAPTKPLIEQHYQFFKSQLPELFADLQLFTGTVPAKKRQEIWQTAEVIFSTPQCIANDLKHYLYSLEEVSLLVIDEAHRCLKNYSYTEVVKFYKQQVSKEMQRILGLTASPGHEPVKIKQICKHLNVNEVELRTRDSVDVKPYLQDLQFSKIEVPFPKEFIEIQTLLKALYDTKVKQLKSRHLIFGPTNKITLLRLQQKLGAQTSFSHSRPNFNILIGLSLTAQAIKIAHALELLETQTLSGLSEYLKKLMRDAEQKKSKGVQTLVKSAEFNAAFLSLTQLIAQKVEHPKIEELKVLVENEFKENKNAKIIIFAQFRETIQTISKNLNKIKNLKSKIFVGQMKKGETGMSQKEQKQTIQDFRDSKINVLCATSIGEEGLDIPEVSGVYFYEPVPSAIRSIQRRGRTARLFPGKLSILITKGTRDEAYHYVSRARERKMHTSINKIKEDLRKRKNTLKDFI